MATGVLYCMTTIVGGLVKIGKTQTDQFERRMYILESNGYKNITGLKRRFAIEVEDYDEKERLLHGVFDRSRVQNTELFAVNVEIVVKLMSALEGKQIYPSDADQTKREVFLEASENLESTMIPDGMYYLSCTPRTLGKEIKATMRHQDDKFIVLAESDICPETSNDVPNTFFERRRTADIQDNILKKDEEFNSASYASMFVIGRRDNGLTTWKDSNGVSLKDILNGGNDDD